ncbi:hypothetical protein ABE073_04930 [Lederbergia citrisecunda]|uniref:hypothetical protein n=1 Tax=Lederbergia citrisecunda TaxID=2833583 RepID=UPI003D293D83
MKYGVSVYFDKESIESGRSSIEKLENKTIEAFYTEITRQLKESITKSVKEQLNNAESEELFLTYDLEDFIRGRRDELDKDAKYV